MDFTEHRSENLVSIDNYENGNIIIDDVKHDGILSLRGGEFSQIAIESFSTLDEAFFQAALENQVLPEIILVGTGEFQQFLHPRIGAFLSQQGIGIEVMATAPACRTFNILQSENRQVWAILWAQ